MSNKIYIKVAPQIIKELVNSLLNCKASFEINVSKHWLLICDIVAFTYDYEKSQAMYRIQINTENNTKDIFIALENVLEFALHFKGV